VSPALRSTESSVHINQECTSSPFLASRRIAGAMLICSKSITLDTWSRDHIQTLRSVGNNASNAIYNPNEQKNPPPTSTDSSERDSEMEKYIRRKYEVGAFKAGANPAKTAEGVNSRDRYRAQQSLGPEKGMENRRNPELNNLVFKKSSREERDLPPLPPLSASRTGSSAGGARERPKPTTVPPPLETETMLINLGGATRATLPLQSHQPLPQQVPTVTQNGNGLNAQYQFIPQTQFQLSPQPQTQNGYFPTQSLQQQYTNNPFMQSQSQQPQYPQQQFLSPSQSPSPYGPYGNGAMGTSPGGTNPFLQMNQGQPQQQIGQGQGQMYAQGQGWNGNGQGQQMQGWQGQGQQQQQQPQFQQAQSQQQYGQQQQQGWPNMGMAGMGMGYAQGH
jgi:stromal membrane-associated protein